jgi:hypothetical protein
MARAAHPTAAERDPSPTLVLASEETPGGATRASLTVTRVDVWSVARVAIVFWSCAGAIAIGALLVAWAILSASGTVSNFEQFVADLTGVEEFRVMSNTVLGAIASAVLVGTAVCSALTVLVASCYNALGALAGGITFEIHERPPASNGVRP